MPIWDHGESSVRQVMETLNADAARPRAYTTYMTIMARLDGKGLLDAPARGQERPVPATFSRDEYADVRARAEVDSIVDQFGELALAHIARQMAALDPARRRALERIARGRLSGPARILGLTAVLGGAGIAAAGAAVGTAIGSVHHVTVGAGRARRGRPCLLLPEDQRGRRADPHPRRRGAATLTLALRAAWRQSRAHRRLLAAARILGPLEGHPGVTVIAGARPEAFCAGFVRPRVYVSRGAVDALTPVELAAVLAHEHQHRRTRDPLRFACGRVVAHAVFFVPVLRPLCDRYADLAEQRADRAAVRASAGRPSPLASALLVFDAAAAGSAASRRRGSTPCWANRTAGACRARRCSGHSRCSPP